jgi:hypothetical protein
MTMEESSKFLGKMTEEQLKGLISTHNSGTEIKFDIKHVYGELLFRDMMRQWDEDTEELEERERSKDNGCGHDQNDDYYGKD